MDAETTELVARLQDRFPYVPEDRVTEAVETASRRLADRPIQDFLPVLVEHAAVEELRKA